MADEAALSSSADVFRLWSQFISTASLLLLQLIVILVAARVCGWLLRRLDQPSVVGEMVAGLLLGPAVMGVFFPSFHAFLFSKSSLDGLASLATLGVILFMFVVGLELRADQGVPAQIKAAGYVGVLSVTAPLLLAIAISPILHPVLAPVGVGFWPFTLFMTCALSITAFPVLARILKDRGMTQSRLGQLTLSAAAVVDLFAWIMLAFVVAIASAKQGYVGLIKAAAGAVLLVGFIFVAIKPFYLWLLRKYAPDSQLSPTILTALMVGMLACALSTEWLHLHAVFGAFLFGVCLPRDDQLLRSMTSRLEPIALTVLMPLFFVLAGLGTTSKVFTVASLAPMVLVIVVSAIGKIVGGALGARLSGCDWRQSLAAGSLMNSRGLMELVVMKVGLDAGLIGREMFTILFVMTVTTTAMTGPMMTLFIGRNGDAGAKQLKTLNPLAES